MINSSAAFLFHSLYRQDIPHSPGGFLLCAGGDVGVGVQSEAGGEVAQHTGDSLDVHAVLQRQRREGMAQVVEADAGQSRPLQHPVQHVVHAVRRDGAAGGRGEHIVAAPMGFHLCQHCHRVLRDAAVAVACFFAIAVTSLFCKQHQYHNPERIARAFSPGFSYSTFCTKFLPCFATQFLNNVINPCQSPETQGKTGTATHNFKAGSASNPPKLCSVPKAARP